MKKLLLLLAIFAAQGVVAQDIRVVHRVNNKSISIDEDVPKGKMLERFGAPKSIDEFYDESYSADVILYNYQEGIFEMADNRFQSFVVKTILYEVVINNKYRIKVGDNWSAFVAQLESEPVSFQADEDRIRLYWGVSTDFLSITLNANGTIRRIAWVVPV